MQELKLVLELDDVNLILEGLGNLPFAKVYGLVAKIQEQAGSQVQSGATTDDGPAADSAAANDPAAAHPPAVSR